MKSVLVEWLRDIALFDDIACEGRLSAESAENVVQNDSFATDKLLELVSLPGNGDGGKVFHRIILHRGMGAPVFHTLTTMCKQFTRDCRRCQVSTTNTLPMPIGIITACAGIGGEALRNGPRGSASDSPSVDMEPRPLAVLGLVAQLSEGVEHLLDSGEGAGVADRDTHKQGHLTDRLGQ